jgi:predicted DNA-binding transcriptional regulator YafY
MLWTLGQLRAGRSLKATDLAARFEVGVRTAYRDLDFLRDELRTPIEYDRARGSWWLTEPTAPLPSIVLSEGELVAIYFAEKVLRQYRGTPYEKDVASAFRKLQAQMTEDVVVKPDRILSFMELDPGPLPEADPGVFREVLAGLTRGRRLVIRYASASSGHTLDRAVDPYRVLNFRGEWYLVAWDERRRAVRDFALHRIRKVTVTGEPSRPSSGFDIKKYMADAFHLEKGGQPADVAVRFAPRQARWIRERRWHRSARVQERLDGGCVLRMRVAVTSELVRWVLQYGPEAEVLAPKRLRREVADRLSEAIASYRARPAPPTRDRQDQRAHR